MSRIIDFRELRDMTEEDRKRVKNVPCECVHCGGPTSGISIGRFDYFGDAYPEATSIILDKVTNEWVVYVYDADTDSPWNQREAARYPVAEVEAIRYLPSETRLYSHTILEDDPKATGIVAYDFLMPE